MTLPGIQCENLNAAQTMLEIATESIKPYLNILKSSPDHILSGDKIIMGRKLLNVALFNYNRPGAKKDLIN